MIENTNNYFKYTIFYIILQTNCVLKKKVGYFYL